MPKHPNYKLQGHFQLTFLITRWEKSDKTVALLMQNHLCADFLSTIFFPKHHINFPEISLSGLCDFIVQDGPL